MSSRRSERLCIKRKSVIIMAEGQIIGEASVAGSGGMRPVYRVKIRCGTPNITSLSYNKPILGIVGREL